jgi:hypothetical protein
LTFPVSSLSLQQTQLEDIVIFAAALGTATLMWWIVQLKLHASIWYYKTSLLISMFISFLV